MPADVAPGLFPNQFLGIQPFTNAVTSTEENLVQAPIKLSSEAWNPNTGVGTSGASLHSGTGTPQGNLAAGKGSIYFRIDAPGVALSTIYACTVSGATAAATTWVGIA